jgi:hypothetical protein
VIQPGRAVTAIVIPPAFAARQDTRLPLVSARWGTPSTATRARVGANVKTTVTVEPRRTVAVRFDAEIGAPQRDRQHQDEIASGTRAVPTLT